MCHVVNKLLRIMMGPLCPPSPPLLLICILCHVCGAVRSCRVQVSVESSPLTRCAKAFRACDSPTISIVMHLMLLPLAMLTTKPRCLCVGIANYAQLELTFHTSSCTYTCPPSCLPCSGLLAGTFFCSTRNTVQSYGTRLRVRDCTLVICATIVVFVVVVVEADRNMLAFNYRQNDCRSHADSNKSTFCNTTDGFRVCDASRPSRPSLYRHDWVARQ